MYPQINTLQGRLGSLRRGTHPLCTHVACGKSAPSYPSRQVMLTPEKSEKFVPWSTAKALMKSDETWLWVITILQTMGCPRYCTTVLTHSQRSQNATLQTVSAVLCSILLTSQVPGSKVKRLLMRLAYSSGVFCSVLPSQFCLQVETRYHHDKLRMCLVQVVHSCTNLCPQVLVRQRRRRGGHQFVQSLKIGHYTYSATPDSANVSMPHTNAPLSRQLESLSCDVSLLDIVCSHPCM